MNKPEATVTVTEPESNQLEVRFGGGMELQNLHNSALYCMHNPDVKLDRELWQAARNYLLNLFISATDVLGKPIGGHDE
jgi:hypothetical protein